MKFLLLMPLLFYPVKTAELANLSEIRGLYQQAAVNKHASAKLNKLLSGVNDSAQPVLLCYKGASEMIRAKYAIDPITKLERFGNGKKLVEMAIGRDTMNLEMRFIRFSIQSNLPSFLGYRNNIEADKHFLITKTKTNNDTELKHMIIKYLSTLSSVTTDELNEMKG